MEIIEAIGKVIDAKLDDKNLVEVVCTDTNTFENLKANSLEPIGDGEFGCVSQEGYIVVKEILASMSFNEKLDEQNPVWSLLLLGDSSFAWSTLIRQVLDGSGTLKSLDPPTISEDLSVTDSDKSAENATLRNQLYFNSVFINGTPKSFMAWEHRFFAWQKLTGLYPVKSGDDSAAQQHTEVPPRRSSFLETQNKMCADDVSAKVTQKVVALEDDQDFLSLDKYKTLDFFVAQEIAWLKKIFHKHPQNSSATRHLHRLVRLTSPKVKFDVWQAQLKSLAEFFPLHEDIFRLMLRYYKRSVQLEETSPASTSKILKKMIQRESIFDPGKSTCAAQGSFIPL